MGGDHLIIPLKGHVFDNRLAGNEHTGGMSGSIAGHALQGHGRINQPLHFRLLFIHTVQLGRNLQCLFQGNAQLHGHGFGHRIGFLIAHAQHSAYVPNHTSGCHGTEGDNLADVIRPVFPCHIVNDFLTAFVAEVHVNIRHADTLRVQEPFEQQLILQRIQHGNAHGIGHNGACAAAPSRADHNPLGLGVVNEIPHNQEVIHVTHAGDHAKFILQPLIGFVLLRRLRVQPLHAFPTDAIQHLVGCFPFRHGIMGQAGNAEFERNIASFRNLMGAIHRIRHGCEKPTHFCLAFHIQLTRFHPHAALIFQRFARLDAHQHFLCICVLLFQIVTVVGGYQRHIHLTGDLNQPGQNNLLIPDAMIHDFHKEMILAENLLHFPDVVSCALILLGQQQLRQVAGNTGGKGNQPLMMLADQFVIHAGLIVIAG